MRHVISLTTVLLMVAMGLSLVGCPATTTPPNTPETPSNLEVWSQYKKGSDIFRMLVKDTATLFVGRGDVTVNVVAQAKDKSSITFKEGNQNVVWNNGSSVDVGLNPGTEPTKDYGYGWGFCNCSTCSRYNYYCGGYFGPGRMWCGPCPYSPSHWHPVHNNHNEWNFDADTLLALQALLVQISGLPEIGQIYGGGDRELWFNIPVLSGVKAVGCSIKTSQGDKAFSIQRESQAEKFTLSTSVSPAGSGSISLSPAGGTYDSGTVVGVTANANTGYTFSHWAVTVDGSTTTGTTDRVAEITMNSNVQLVAMFTPATQPQRFTLTTSVTPAGSGSISLNPSGGSYTSGTVVGIMATVNAGYQFSHWLVNGVVGSNSSTAQVTMDSDVSLSAVFTPTSQPQGNRAILKARVNGRFPNATLTFTFSLNNAIPSSVFPGGLDGCSGTASISSVRWLDGFPVPQNIDVSGTTFMDGQTVSWTQPVGSLSSTFKFNAVLFRGYLIGTQLLHSLPNAGAFGNPDNIQFLYDSGAGLETEITKSNDGSWRITIPS